MSAMSASTSAEDVAGQSRVMLFVNDEDDEPRPLCIERAERGTSEPASDAGAAKESNESFMLSPAKKGGRVALRDTTFDIVSHDHREARVGGGGGGGGGGASSVISIVSPALNNLTLQSVGGRATEPLLFSNTNMGRWEQWKVLRSERELGCDASVKTLLRNMRWGTELQVQVVRPVQLAKELINQWSSLVIDQVSTRHSLQRQLRLLQSDAEEAVRDAQEQLRALRMCATRQGAPSDVRSIIATPHEDRQALFGEHAAALRHGAGPGLGAGETRRLSPVASMLDEVSSPLSSPSIDDSELPTTTPGMRGMRDSGERRASAHYRQQLMGKMFESWAVAYAQTPPGSSVKKKRVVLVDVPNNHDDTVNDDDDTTNATSKSVKIRAHDTPRTRLGNALDGLREELDGKDADTTTASLSVTHLLTEMERRGADTGGVCVQLNRLEEEIAEQRAFTRSLGNGERARALVALQAAFGIREGGSGAVGGGGGGDVIGDIRALSVRNLLRLLKQHELDTAPVLNAMDEIGRHVTHRRPLPHSKMSTAMRPTPAAGSARPASATAAGAVAGANIGGARGTLRTPSPPVGTTSSTSPSSTATTPLPIELPASLAGVTVSQFHKLCKAYGVDDLGVLRAEQVASDGITGEALARVSRLLREQGERVDERDDKLAILSIRRMPLRFFTKVLLMSGKEAACAEVHTLVLAVAACMKGASDGTRASTAAPPAGPMSSPPAHASNGSRAAPTAGHDDDGSRAVRETPQKRYSSWYDSESSSSDDDDDGGLAHDGAVGLRTRQLSPQHPPEKTSPLSHTHRQMRLHRLRKHRQLFL